MRSLRVGFRVLGFASPRRCEPLTLNPIERFDSTGAVVFVCVCDLCVCVCVCVICVCVCDLCVVCVCVSFLFWCMLHCFVVFCFFWESSGVTRTVFVKGNSDGRGNLVLLDCRNPLDLHPRFWTVAFSCPLFFGRLHRSHKLKTTEEVLGLGSGESWVRCLVLITALPHEP